MKNIHRCVLWMLVQEADFQCFSKHRFVCDGGVTEGLRGEVDENKTSIIQKTTDCIEKQTPY